MGEPLAPSIGKWFEKTFLQKGEAIINTYFQTETGGIICSPKYSNKCSKNPHGSVGDTISKYIRIIKLSENKKCRMNYSKDMCKSSLEILDKTILIPTDPKNTKKDIDNTIKNIKKAALAYVNNQHINIKQKSIDIGKFDYSLK